MYSTHQALESSSFSELDATDRIYSGQWVLNLSSVLQQKNKLLVWPQFLGVCVPEQRNLIICDNLL